MANNRLILYHRGTGIGIGLGKRMGFGWYGAPDKESLNDFFEAAQADGDQDDFMLLIEDASGDGSGNTPIMLVDEWHWTSEKIDGFNVIKIGERQEDQ